MTATEKPSVKKFSGLTIALVILCVVFICATIGVTAYYGSLTNSQNSKINSLNSQISNLNSQVNNLTSVVKQLTQKSYAQSQSVAYVGSWTQLAIGPVWNYTCSVVAAPNVTLTYDMINSTANDTFSPIPDLICYQIFVNGPSNYVLTFSVSNPMSQQQLLDLNNALSAAFNNP
jgi:outer membrane murein-binding lipoprotein Lpp